MDDTVSDIIRSAHSTLAALVEHVDALDEIEGKRKSAATQLHATILELSQASKRLENVKVELKRAEAQLESKRHIINDEAARALQDLNRQLSERREEGIKLDLQIREKRAEMDNVLAGMQALQQRLRV